MFMKEKCGGGMILGHFMQKIERVPFLDRSQRSRLGSVNGG